MRTDNAADMRLDAMLKNCIFYISPMYEFSHSLGQKRPKDEVRVESALPQTADIGRRGWQVSSVPSTDLCAAANDPHGLDYLTT